MRRSAETPVLGTIRRWLLVMVTVVMLGTVVDLVLLGHYEEPWQWPPFVMIGIALGVIAWATLTGSARAVRALRAVMVLFIATGLLGMLLHYKGNREFQREIDPAIGGWALVAKVITAKAPPALAPAAMIQIGLLGLLYSYRHPSLDHHTAPPSTRP